MSEPPLRLTLGFLQALPPRVEVLGVGVEIQAAIVLFGFLLLPFALGFIAKRQPLLAGAAFGAVLITMSLGHAMLLEVGGIYESPIPFPWSYLAQWALWSIPAGLTGYLAAHIWMKRGAAAP